MPWTVARPSPVPLPGSLVVKNGSNRRACTSGVMPVPVSRHREHHVGTRRHREVRRRVVLVELDVGGLDRQRAAVRHGVARVDREVHDDLLDLPAVGLHAAPAPAARLSTTFTSSPIRRPSIARMSVTTTFRSSSVGSMICLRLNARSWRVSAGGALAGLLDLADVRLARIVRDRGRPAQLAVARESPSAGC